MLLTVALNLPPATSASRRIIAPTEMAAPSGPIVPVLKLVHPVMVVSESRSAAKPSLSTVVRLFRTWVRKD